MEDAGAVRRLARVRVDTLIWLVFAIVLFTISAWLTFLITNIEPKSRHNGVAVTFIGIGKIDPRPSIDIQIKRNRLELSIQTIALHISTIRLGAFSKSDQASVQCESSGRATTTSWEAPTNDEFPERDHTPPSDIAITPLSYVVPLDLQNSSQTPGILTPKSVTTVATDSKLQEQIEKGASATCSLPIDIIDDTFTSRALDLTISDGLFIPAVDPVDALSLPKQQSFFPRQVSLTNDDAQEIHVTNVRSGQTLLASSVVSPFTGYDTTSLHHAVTEHFAWESKTATSRRDILITVIGTLIALGAAALIEACRPYIEILVRVGGSR